MQHHILTITDDEYGRDCEVEHLTSCPTSLNQGYLQWTCQVGWYLDEFGLPEHLTVKEPGEYDVEFWVETRTNYTGVTEYEYGVDLV
jgi:hypothetical protein